MEEEPDVHWPTTRARRWAGHDNRPQERTDLGTKPDLEKKYRIERAKWDAHAQAHAHAHVGILPTDPTVPPTRRSAARYRGKPLFSGISEFLACSLDDLTSSSMAAGRRADRDPRAQRRPGDHL